MKLFSIIYKFVCLLFYLLMTYFMCSMPVDYDYLVEHVVGSYFVGLIFGAFASVGSELITDFLEFFNRKIKSRKSSSTED